MWYVFPQVGGLGVTPISRRYAIESSGEAAAFLTHAVLGTRYRLIVDAVWHQVVERGVSVHELLGSPDDMKLVSSLTLFAGIATRLEPHSPELAVFRMRAQEILDAAYAEGLARCATTERFLAA